MAHSDKSEPFTCQSAELIRWIAVYRLKHGINPIAGPAPELSCTMHGEGLNLLRQLILTEQGTGCWQELINDFDSELLQLVLDARGKLCN